MTLIHNPTAGDEEHSREILFTALAEAGHQVTYRSIKDDGWEDGLRGETELVVVAGGDGTVRKVFKKLGGSTIAATLFPLGSANNIARTLGFEHDDAARLIRGWERGTRRPYDLGRLELASADDRFVESIGGGIFADVLARAEEADGADGDEKVELGLRLLHEAVVEAPVHRFEMELDDQDLSGDFLAVEAMNIRETGPNVLLAPGADPGDGLLDVVLVGEQDRAELVDYVDARMEERSLPQLQLDVQRGRGLSIRLPEGCALRVDDVLLADGDGRDGIGVVCAKTDECRLLVLMPAEADR